LSHLGLGPTDRKNQHPTFVTKGVAHPVYHHDLRPNVDMMTVWGPMTYKLCTNEFGFKISCDNKKESRKNFDIAFIGDSFTESVGTTYEDSFVGMYARKNPDIAVANLGVSSYSPRIYWKKIEFLLNNGFTFKHLVVLPDISDIRDEALYLDAEEQSGSAASTENRANTEPTAVKNRFHAILMKYFKYTWYINCQLYEYFDDEAEEKLLKRVVESPISIWTLDTDSPHYGKTGVLGGIRKNLEYMRKLKQLLDEHGIKMTIVVYPWPAQVFFEDRSHPGVQIWNDFCIKENCYNFIDANQFFFDEIQRSSKVEVIKKYYIRGDSHFNEAGNKAMFEIINAHVK
jgi:lysophospholipase L1-like esterase